MHVWGQSHVAIVWNTRETGDIDLSTPKTFEFLNVWSLGKICPVDSCARLTINTTSIHPWCHMMISPHPLPFSLPIVFALPPASQYTLTRPIDCFGWLSTYYTNRCRKNRLELSNHPQISRELTWCTIGIYSSADVVRGKRIGRQKFISKFVENILKYWQFSISNIKVENQNAWGGKGKNLQQFNALFRLIFGDYIFK